MTYMRMLGRVAERSSRELQGNAGEKPWRERPYLFTQSLWSAMAYLSNHPIQEGAEVDIDSVRGMPPKVHKDARYGVGKCGLDFHCMAYVLVGTNTVVGYVVQIENDRDVLGYYAYKPRNHGGQQ